MTLDSTGAHRRPENVLLGSPKLPGSADAGRAPQSTQFIERLRQRLPQPSSVLDDRLTRALTSASWPTIVRIRPPLSQAI
jgi:RNase H-fold protein (predicted Holliday junction resolvase)